MGLKTSDFLYDLPEELIAQEPLPVRSGSRLMKVDRMSGAAKSCAFSDIKSFLKRGDVLVLNETRVIPARLFGRKRKTGGTVEVLLLKRTGGNRWEVLVKPGKKARPGSELVFGDGILTGKIIDIVEDGNRIIEFTYEGIFEEILDSLGEMPLPPYIHKKLEDKERYQTVYSRVEGSAAAPTAGLHFTEELLEELREKGIETVPVVLHVGLGTFRPVKVENIEDHKMHSEHYFISKESAERINRAKDEGRRVICVGTTSCRTVESASDDTGHIVNTEGDTDIFIYPGYRFKVTDGLITNFHLPGSTLLMLVSAFSSRQIMMAAYKKAVDEKYRFFSFGDAMLII